MAWGNDIPQQGFEQISLLLRHHFASFLSLLYEFLARIYHEKSYFPIDIQAVEWFCIIDCLNISISQVETGKKRGRRCFRPERKHIGKDFSENYHLRVFFLRKRQEKKSTAQRPQIGQSDGGERQ